MPGAAAPRYSPPDLPAVAKNQLDVLSVEIAQNNLADAAKRIDSLLKDSPDGLIASDDAAASSTGGMISLQTWIEQLPEAQRTALTREYRVQFEDAASRSVRQLAERKSVEPAQFLAIARRYPFAPAATDAIVAAARRSAELGDTTGAANLFSLARARGWKDKSTDAPTSQPTNSYSGPLPFQVPWFANLLSDGSPTSNASAATLQEERLMPVTNGGVVYMSTSRGAMAVKEESVAPLWQVTPGDDAPPNSPRPVSRGASFAPALLCDDQGAARIVVVRQMGATGEYELRAMRASDGKRLWSTDHSPDLRGLTIASNPALAGRYVYALGVDIGEQAGRLVMLAFDVTNGRVLWRSEIGSVARRGSGRFTRSRDPVLDASDPWQNLSSPAVDADSVYIAPNCGAVVAVDRFAGHLRWIRPYVTTTVNPITEPAAVQRRAANVRVRELPSTGIPRASVFRWNTTPVRVGDDMLVVAPQDSDRVFAFSSRSGKQLWHTDSLAQATLFGAAGKLVFLSDRSIIALDIEKLDAAWTWDGGAVGPATLSATNASPQILVPTAGGLVTLSASDGAVVSTSTGVPDLAGIAKSETIRTAMQETGALDLLVNEDKPANQPNTPPPTPKKRNR
ncbi:MAG: PQQ-binding-like beta-propeller repeat protein [Anaerolineae bacterium]|nr:PQQ-binding-like beta-propeller repeat protein [Phycisphaerae bacterium]